MEQPTQAFTLAEGDRILLDDGTEVLVHRVRDGRVSLKIVEASERNALQQHWLPRMLGLAFQH
ncbi:hypothetical protein D9M68_178000 [compost metagenome]|uniref:Uncharacterized protein n=1 Tax=Pseudomonas jinjuensis TaxID=198616 RepID=A0A1H0FAY6_9PSED|nr:hypothetical protein [Pseudomonas jinjuensis]SDN91848.1 hypothetical protein SAMN05216193_106125 [Pseudomonas jinjuensis]